MAALRAGVSVLLVLFTIESEWAAAAPSCLDDSGNAVDWYTVYKMPVAYSPHRKKHVFPPHLYMDSKKPSWSMSAADRTLNDSAQAVGLTLKQIYEAYGSPDVGYFLYNDEKPAASGGAVTLKHGHTKGVLVASATGSGFWLVHSVPKFPPPSNLSYAYPYTGMEYGQHFLCVTLGSADFDDVGYQLRLNDAWLYDFNWPTLLHKLSSNLTELSLKVPLPPATRSGAQSSTQTLRSTPSTFAFVSFAKTAKYGKDLYAGLVAPSLQSGLLTETWSHGNASLNINSTCDTQYQVENIASLASESLGISFPNFQDHSKFALSDSHYVCIGDINRQVTQLKRGGGTVCFQSAAAALAYRSLVAETQPCPSSAAHMGHTSEL